MSKDIYNVEMEKIVNSQKNTYRENNYYFENQIIKGKITPKKENLSGRKSGKEIKIEKIKIIEKDINFLSNVKETRIYEEIEKIKLIEFEKIYDITEIILNKSKEITTKNFYDRTVKVFSWNNSIGVYNEINDVKIKENKEISIDMQGILLENKYDFKISIGSNLLGHNSIFLSEKNKKEKIISEELIRLGINQEELGEINNLKKNLEKIKRKKIDRAQIKDEFNQYFEEINKNKKISNNKILEEMLDKYYLEKSKHEFKETLSENRTVKKNYNFKMLSVSNVKTHLIEKSLLKLRNNNKKYFEELLKEKNSYNKIIKENKPIMELTEEREWNFIFDSEMLVGAYFNKIKRHINDLKDTTPIYKLNIIDYLQSKDEIIWQEKDTIRKNITKSSSENKVIDLPGYLKTLYLLEEGGENTEKNKKKENIKKSILENKEKILKSKEEINEKKNKIEILINDTTITDYMHQSYYDDKIEKIEEMEPEQETGIEAKRELVARKKEINENLANRLFDETHNYLEEIKEKDSKKEKISKEDEDYINESNSYYTKRYKYVF
ncbi:hypothetical protein [Fusobacterium sp. PH5-44]|uniref:hypothetical protein n=1 Tax=unclassified Fusobacterium TaxID=2648384 RepID=UPI003D21F9F0